MKPLSAFLLLGVALLVAAPDPAQDLPHLEFVRGLRARHYSDLALEYLEKLQKTAKTPDERRDIAFEIAQTRLAMARDESNATKRQALYAQARRELEDFQRRYAGSPLANAATLEVAKVALYQARNQLARIDRAETRAARNAEALKARQLLRDAGAQLKKAEEQFAAQLAKLQEPKTDQEKAEKKRLEQVQLEARYERAVSLFEQCRTYLNDTDDERAKVVKEAKAELARVAAVDAANPLCTQARVWQYRCLLEEGDPASARKQLENVLKLPRGPGMDAARRLAMYFLILILPETKQSGAEDTVALTRALCEQWVRENGNYLTTPEGCAVRFRLAQAYVEQANQKQFARERPRLYELAKEQYQHLEQTDNEYTDRARAEKVRIIFQASGKEKASVNSYTTFDQCYVRAQWEAMQIGEDAKKIKEPDKFAEARKAHLGTVIASLDKGLRLAEGGRSKPSEMDLGNATGLLAWAYLNSGEPGKALAVAEKAARARPGSSQAPTLAIYALQAYNQVLGDPAKAGLDAEGLNEYREKMRSLATWMKEKLADDGAVEMARHQLGLLLLREEKYAEAVAELSAIKPTYPAAIHAYYQLAMAAFEADKRKLAPVGPDQRPFQERAIDTLVHLPDLPPDADPSTTQLFLYAKLRLGQHYYSAKRYDELEKLMEPVVKRLPTLKLDNPQTKEELENGVVSLGLLAKFGRADKEYNEGHYAKARELLDPLLEDLKADRLPALKKNAPLKWALVGLALRANLQDNKPDRVRDLLQAVQKQAAADPQGGGAATVLQNLIGLMRQQMREAKKRNDKALVEKTAGQFTTLLDELRKAQKDPSPEMARLLAQSYASLDRHAQAVELLAAVKEPKGDKGKEPDPKQVQNYRACRLLHVRELRLNNQVEEAQKLLTAVLAEPWASKNLDALKEKILLTEAGGKPGRASTEWDQILKALKRKMDMGETAAREPYFECHCHMVRCYFKWAQGQEGKKRGDGITAAARFIVDVENTYKDQMSESAKARYQELLDQEKELKQQYDALKAKN
ncbi:MAG TPA: hypothetical protein VFA26_15925 [Gemmataceae bacterium]|nr:hypothetical protein [Gemmataceae bacterium]